MRPLVRPVDAVLSLLVLGTALFAALKPPRTSGSVVEVSVAGRVVMVLPLSRDGEWRVGGMTVEVSDGAVRVKESDCPDRFCVRCGRVREVGRTIVCVPNRTVVRVVGRDSGFGVDGVTE